MLVQTYKDDKDNSKFDLPQIIVKKVKTIFLSDKYNGFIKLDVDNFYPSIDHSILLGELKNIIESEYIIELILRAIKTATVSKSAKGDKISQKGVPQGLSISNILATIFLSKIDAKLRSIPKTEYFRYVDDIFILCDFSNVDSVSKRVIRLFKKAGLKIHPPNKSATKSVTGKISSPFEYLGYRFDKDQSIISARKGSKEKLEESLVSIFTSYNHSKQKDADYLLWRLNLRITGCIFQKKGRGWLFYFAEINDETMLHQLDIYVETLTKRFGVNIEPKKFVRSYYEITHSRYDTNYVPNFDKYTPDEMRKALAILGVDTSKLSDIEISYKFHRRLTKEIKDLQTDLQNFRS